MQPKVKIHIWGGLGSQLHAYYLAESLKLRHPSRNFIMVFHSSGISRRFPEIQMVLTEFGFSNVDDFKINSSVNKLINFKSVCLNFLKICVRYCVSPIFVNAKFNNELQNSKLRIWNLEIRGHYSNNVLDPIVLKKVFENLLATGVIKIQNELSEQIVLHMRLGDLIELESKQVTDVDRVNKIVEELSKINGNGTILIHSDSSQKDVQNFLTCDFSILNFAPSNTRAAEALSEFISCKIFIGTSSKLSFWAAIWRATQYSTLSYIPVEHKNHLKTLLVDFELEDKILFY